MAKAAVTGTLLLSGLVGVAALGALGVKPPDAQAGGSFQPGADVGLDAEQLRQATRALRVADRLKAKPLPVLAMVVGGLGESMFRAVPNGDGSGYCGVFQAHPSNIACGDTELQARSFLKGGRGFQAGGAIALSRTVDDPGEIATRVEASGKPGSFYGVHRPQAERIIRAWRAGGLVQTVPFDGMQGTPKHIIDSLVLPMSNAAGVPRTVAQNDAANAGHGPTESGGLSDHQGPPEQRWAADMSNGTGPTREMDALARRLAAKFDLPWHGAGAVTNPNFHGYRVQMIYRSNVGGNHFNHVHFGIATVQPVYWPSPTGRG